MTSSNQPNNIPPMSVSIGIGDGWESGRHLTTITTLTTMEGGDNNGL